MWVRKEVDCNWKAGIESFIEGYHVIGTHPQTLSYNGDGDSAYDTYEGEPNFSRFVFPAFVPGYHIEYDIRNKRSPTSCSRPASPWPTVGPSRSPTAPWRGPCSPKGCASFWGRPRLSIWKCCRTRRSSTAFSTTSFPTWSRSAGWVRRSPTASARSAYPQRCLFEIYVLGLHARPPAGTAPALTPTDLGPDDRFGDIPAFGILVRSSIKMSPSWDSIRRACGPRGNPASSSGCTRSRAIRHYHRTLDRFIFGEINTPGRIFRACTVHVVTDSPPVGVVRVEPSEAMIPVLAGETIIEAARARLLVAEHLWRRRKLPDLLRTCFGGSHHALARGLVGATDWMTCTGCPGTWGFCVWPARPTSRRRDRDVLGSEKARRTQIVHVVTIESIIEPRSFPMTHHDELADRSELTELAYRYASAVDACDRDAFLAVFHSDGRLSTFAPNATEPFAVQTGHEELAWIPGVMRDRFVATMHVMTNHLLEIEGDTATGSVYCSARHCSQPDGWHGPRRVDPLRGPVPT